MHARQIKIIYFCSLFLITIIANGQAKKIIEVKKDTDLMFFCDFEGKKLAKIGDSKLEHTLKKTKRVLSPARSGKYALKMTLDRNKYEGIRDYRTDFWLENMYKKFTMNKEYWYGFSTYWPKSWKPDTQPELFVQWVGWRNYGPSLAIYVYGDKYNIKKRWGRKLYKNLWKGKLAKDKGKWVDWVFHIKWSTNKNGLVEVWKDGKKIVSDKGANCGPGKSDKGANCGPGKFADYFKFGIYKWPWKHSPKKTPSTVTQRIFYIDEIRIGDENANFQSVSPPVE